MSSRPVRSKIYKTTRRLPPLIAWWRALQPVLKNSIQMKRNEPKNKSKFWKSFHENIIYLSCAAQSAPALSNNWTVDKWPWKAASMSAVFWELGDVPLTGVPDWRSTDKMLLFPFWAAIIRGVSPARSWEVSSFLMWAFLSKCQKFKTRFPDF